MAAPMDIDRDILHLPEEITLHIFHFLGFEDLGKAVRVCKYWKHMTEDNSLWRDLYKHHFSETDSLKRRIRCGSMYWKNEFHAKLLLERAWLKGLCHTRCVAKHNCRVNCMQFDSRENRVAAGYDGHILIWDLTQANKLRCTLTGHTQPICFLQYDDDVLVSCSVDRTIRIFDIPHQRYDADTEGSGRRASSPSSVDVVEAKQTLHGHNEQVNRLQFDHQKIVSGSRDTTVKIWDFTTGCCLRTLTGHGASVLCVKFDGDLIASSSGDHTIKLWDARIGGSRKPPFHRNFGPAVRASDLMRCHSSDSLLSVSSFSRSARVLLTGSCGSLAAAASSAENSSESSSACVRTFAGHEHWVYYLQIKAPQPHMLVSGSRDASLRVWDMRGGRGGNSGTSAAGPNAANSGCVATLRGHSDSVCTLQADATKIVSGSVDMTIRIWSVDDFNEKAVLEGHNGSVYCLQFEEDLLLSGGGDGNVCAFEFAPRGGVSSKSGWWSSWWWR